MFKKTCFNILTTCYFFFNHFIYYRVIMLSMIELKGGLLLGKNTPKQEVSFNYEKGEINYIDYPSFYIYKFLRLKDQALEKGEFFVDGVKIYPNEDDEKTLIFLAINSLVRVDLCFLVDKNDKKEKVQFVQEQLLELKSFPMNTEIDKNRKIAAIFEKIAQILPSYMLVDLNDDVNSTNLELTNQLSKYKDVLTIIVLNQKPKVVKEAKPIVEDEQIEMIDLEIGEARPLLYEAEYKDDDTLVVYDSKEKSFGKALLETLKGNLMVFLAFVIPAIGVIAFSLLSPIYAKTSNKILLIPFIITIVVCFGLYMLMTYKCANFGSYKSKKENRKRIIFFIINSIVTLAAYGLGFLIYFLFKKFDVDIRDIANNTTGIVLSIIFTVILITANLYVYPLIHTLINKIKRKR